MGIAPAHALQASGERKYRPQLWRGGLPQPCQDPAGRAPTPGTDPQPPRRVTRTLMAVMAKAILRRPSMLVLSTRRMCWNFSGITSDCAGQEQVKGDLAAFCPPALHHPGPLRPPRGPRRKMGRGARSPSPVPPKGRPAAAVPRAPARMGPDAPRAPARPYHGARSAPLQPRPEKKGEVTQCPVFTPPRGSAASGRGCSPSGWV